MQSSSKLRCVESAQSHLQGLYGGRRDLQVDPYDKAKINNPPFQQKEAEKSNDFIFSLKKAVPEEVYENTKLPNLQTMLTASLQPVWTLDKNHDYMFFRDGGRWVCPNAANILNRQAYYIQRDMERDLDAPGWMKVKGDSINTKLKKIGTIYYFPEQQ